MPLLAAVALALAGRGADATQPLAGAAYTGQVKARVAVPGQPVTLDRGVGTARFTELGNGRQRLSVRGMIDAEAGDAGFDMEGVSDGHGWRGRSGDVDLVIGVDGNIRGSGTVKAQAFTFSGRASPIGFALVVDVELLQDQGRALPAGTRLRFAYDLRRAGASAPGAIRSPTGTGQAQPCQTLRYEVRPRPDLASGSLSMVRVPVCKD